MKPATISGGVGVLLPYGTWTFALSSFTPGNPAPPGSVTATLTAAGVQNIVLVSAS